ncbi:MAG: hypothetical protein A4C66_06775 [Nitrospira sp. HN-bin3]|uniref:DUF3108 domain-containing protein n=1 Tax=Nitrospira cf. moscoviensis SBR1015 TaxID=96242 RepID=UPI000A09D453|nr:DUF3108 domain-containing protein [Nitrospira cf. moscoviensis SBR1015]OQW46124.1 MAG: hypothetical protein A4C66_06775 [Nitrospira sp. HN-bin3]
MLESVSTSIGLARLPGCIGRPAAIGVVLLTLMAPLGTTAAEGLGETTRPFTVGERLTYEVSWFNLTAVIAVMEVAPAEGNGDTSVTAKLIGTARSTPIITKFFPVDNRVESVLDLDTLTPEHLTFRRREGKKNEDIEYTFHQKEGAVTAVRGGTTESLSIPTGTHDIISCLYYTRAVLPPKPGASLKMNVYHDKKNRPVEVRVEGIETLEGSWGRVETVRTRVIMPFHGLFMNKGDIHVWVTNDERKIPVRMKAKVVLGAIVADLVDGWSGVRSVKPGS